MRRLGDIISSMFTEMMADREKRYEYFRSVLTSLVDAIDPDSARTLGTLKVNVCNKSTYNVELNVADIAWWDNQHACDKTLLLNKPDLIRSALIAAILARLNETDLQAPRTREQTKELRKALEDMRKADAV